MTNVLYEDGRERRPDPRRKELMKLKVVVQLPHSSLSERATAAGIKGGGSEEDEEEKRKTGGRSQ